jgi:hypothetical protein
MISADICIPIPHTSSRIREFVPPTANDDQKTRPKDPSCAETGIDLPWYGSASLNSKSSSPHVKSSRNISGRQLQLDILRRPLPPTTQSCHTTTVTMTRGLRSSGLKKNKKALRKRVFGPVEQARQERMSQKLASIIAAPKPERNEMEHVEEGEHIPAQRCGILGWIC